MNRPFSALLLLMCSLRAIAQTDSTTVIIDSVPKQTLNEVVITAYEQYKNRLDIPAAIGIVRGSDLNRSNSTNILPAVNNIPGVRMEERSPGSYRFGIRGSASNAPFGVRNIKVYYNDIPYTDPGGNTYVNSLGYYNIRSLEVIKEPGSSLYGAGTGGVLLINSFPESWHRGASVYYTGGSYNLKNIAGEVRVGNKAFQNTITYQHLSSDGYRKQSALNKNVASWDALYKRGKGALAAHFLYNDLTYETPGGLTKAQYDTDPSNARPGAGAIPGAIQSKATIYQKTFLTGFTYRYQFNTHWQHITTLYGAYTQMVNPNIRNYSRVLQPNFGGRTILKFEQQAGSVSLACLAGAELQQGYSSENTYDNNAGTAGNIQQLIEVDNNLASVFAQVNLGYRKWLLSGGASINRLAVKIHTFFPTPYNEVDKNFDNEIAPRIALLYKLNSRISFYTSVGKGYSPPTTEQITPTGSHPNIGLKSSEGWNYQLGSRGYLANDRLYYDANIFYMALTNAIVQRRDSAGGDYYLNAGGTEQAGAELLLKYKLMQSTTSFISLLNIAAGYTYSLFTYRDFIQLTTDYSGKMLPGIAPHTISGSIDVVTKQRIYLNLNAYYSDAIPLNDANNASAKAYTLLDARLGYKMNIRKFGFDVFAGANNLLDEKYSLGNDINAANGRYFNAAPGRNYFAGLSINANY